MSFLDKSHLNFILDASKCKYPPGLYLVGTPIGNLEDITLRALSTLQKADVIACEDKRVTKKLLQTYGIHHSTQTLITYNDAKGDERGLIKDALFSDKRVALVSDAGMPLISDPGYKLVQFARENNIFVTCIPGASAPLMALTLSGLPCHEFTFKGFFPKKEKERQLVLETLLPDHTYIFFDSPQRIHKSSDVLSKSPNIESIVVARELTKRFEQIVWGTPETIGETMKSMPEKGEIVLLLKTKRQENDIDHVKQQILKLLQTHSAKSVVDIVKQTTNLSKKEIYDLVLLLKKDLSHD